MFGLFKKTSYTPNLNKEVLELDNRRQDALKKATDEAQLEVWKAPQKKMKTDNEIIQEIHDSFDTEVDKLLEFTNNTASLHSEKQELIDKVKRLKALGFTNTKEVKEGETEIARLAKLESENKQKEDLQRAINYFSQNYPNYKFITDESVNKLCNKYGLVFGDSERYTGTIPDVNLKHIEEFKISDEDIAYYELQKELDYDAYHEAEMRSHYHSMVNQNNYYIIKKVYCTYGLVKSNKNNANRRFNKAQFNIVAPQKDFNMKGYVVSNNEIVKLEIVPKDPIVLCPVGFENKKYNLIITKWGLEASDEDVVNANHN